MATIFLSHSNLDRDIAYQIYLELKQNGVYCWIDKAEIKPGESLIYKIQDAINRMDYLGAILTPNSVTSKWVMEELNMALMKQINIGRVYVIPLLIKDCNMPGFLLDKKYIDFRSDFDKGMIELINYLKGFITEVSTPRQMLLVKVLEGASKGLLETLCPSEWKVDKEKTINLIRQFEDIELKAAVAISVNWKVDRKWWEESDLIDMIKERMEIKDDEAFYILDKLKEKRFIIKDPFYGDQAYTLGDRIRVLYNLAQQSGLFDYLPTPCPYKLSSFLVYNGAIKIWGLERRWIAWKGSGQIDSDNGAKILAYIARDDPPKTWLFSSDQDSSPQKINKAWGFGILGNWEVKRREKGGAVIFGESEFVALELEEFDDLQLLTE